MSKKNLNSVNNEFIEYLKGSLKVIDNLIKIDNDILMAKNKSYINIKNRGHIINNDMLINKTNRIMLKSLIRKNVESLKKIKNNHFSVKKYTDSFSIDLKKLKEEHINNSNKRVKAQSIVINNKAICSNNRFNHFINRFNRFINKSSSKTNAHTIKDSAIVKNQVDACAIKDSAIVKNQVDACNSTDDLIVKNQVDACTSTDDLILKNQVDACNSTDDLIVKNHVNVCTSTDDVCTNENESENEPCTNENENENEHEQCTNESDDSDNDSDDDDDIDDDDDSDDDSDDDDTDDKPGNNDNKPGNNDNNPGNNDNKNNKQGNKDNDNKPVNKDNKASRQMNFAISQRELFLNNLTKIIELANELNDEIHDDDKWLVSAQLNQINPLLDDLIDSVQLIIYNKKREKNEVINICVDKDKDIEGYVGIYNKIVNDKLEFVNEISELLNNAIEKKDFKNLKDDVLKLIGNSCICDVKRKSYKKDNKKRQCC